MEGFDTESEIEQVNLKLKYLELKAEQIKCKQRIILLNKAGKKPVSIASRCIPCIYSRASNLVFTLFPTYQFGLCWVTNHNTVLRFCVVVLRHSVPRRFSTFRRSLEALRVEWRNRSLTRFSPLRYENLWIVIFSNENQFTTHACRTLLLLCYDWRLCFIKSENSLNLISFSYSGK